MALTEKEELELLELEAQAASGGTRPKGALSTVPRGFNTGLANVLGLPVDVANLALSGVDRVAGTQLSGDMPVGGSRWLKKAMRGFDRVPGMSQVTYDNLQDLPESDRKFGVFGEVLGGSMLPAAAPLAYARGTASAAPSLLRPAVDMARNAPGRFAATEAGLATGSALGGMTATHIAPESDAARFAGEVVGGFVNPTRIGSAAINSGQSLANAVTTNFSRAGRERAAARVVQDTIARTGEDKDALIQALRASDPFRLDLTAGQQTGSRGLLAVENRLSQLDPEFSARAEARPDEALSSLRNASERVAATGQPVDFKAAMDARYGDTIGAIAARRRGADAAAKAGRQQIGDVSRAEMADAGVQARESLVSAKNAARGRESAMWQQVPRNSTIEPSNVLAARENIRSRLLPNENLPPPVELFTGDLARQAAKKVDTGVLDASGESITKQGRAEATSGELLRLRNRALVKAREARAKGDFDLASQMDVIAEGALDDLGGLSDTARNFSRNLNQNFRQGFAGDVLARDATGGPRIEPEQTLERAFGSGGTQADVRMRQLGDAASFGGQGEAMLSQQDRFLRGAAQSVIDPATNRVNPNKLSQFMRQNESLLQRFPQLRTDLSSADSAERAFARVEAITDKAQRNANKTLVARIAGVENPVGEVNRILSVANANRVRDYASLSRSAAKAGPEAVAGLRSSTLEGVFRNATDGAGNFDFERLAQQLMYKGPSGRDFSLLEMMRSNGVLDKAADERLRAIVNRATRLKSAVNTPVGVNKLVDDPDALTDFLTRTVGANIGATAGGGSGATLVAASAGSKLMRKYFEKLPAAKVQEVLIEAAENPRFMAMLLEKPKTAKQARELTRQMNAFLFSAGITAASDEVNERRPLDQSLDAYAQ